MRKFIERHQWLFAIFVAVLIIATFYDEPSVVDLNTYSAGPVEFSVPVSDVRVSEEIIERPIVVPQVVPPTPSKSVSSVGVSNIIPIRPIRLFESGNVYTLRNTALAHWFSVDGMSIDVEVRQTVSREPVPAGTYLYITEHNRVILIPQN